MKYYFIGTDEAGYGPNLGPLSVSSSLWEADISGTKDPLNILNLRVLKSTDFQEGFRICDSKRLFHSGHLTQLERTFFFAFENSVNCKFDLPLFRQIESFKPLYSSWLSVINQLSISPDTEKNFVPPWEKEISFPLPLTGHKDWVESFSDDLHLTNSRLEREGVRLLGVASRRVQPQEFNLLVNHYGLKSELLAEITLETALFLLRPILEDRFEKKEIILCCDKLGGRNFYGELLKRFFPESELHIEIESRPMSLYRLPLNHGRISILFQAKGESNIPTALSSIVSKYQREISMEAFNRYWQKRLPGLAPTAGYPVDAKRFLSETKELRKIEGIEDNCFWRIK